jgi:hypothetical protein
MRDEVLEHVTGAGDLFGNLVVAVNHRTRLETRGTCTDELRLIREIVQ